MTRIIRLVGVAAVVSVAVAGEARAGELRGSRASMVRQHDVAVREDYTFLRTSEQVRRFAFRGILEPVWGNGDFELARVSFPYARPEVKRFIEELAAGYREATGEPLVVTSLTRPTSRQPDNASSLSVHPAGMAVDLRVPRVPSHRRWLEDALLELERAGVLDVTRERRPPHYHVAVFPGAYAARSDVLAAATTLTAAVRGERVAQAAPRSEEARGEAVVQDRGRPSPGSPFGAAVAALGGLLLLGGVWSSGRRGVTSGLSRLFRLPRRDGARPAGGPSGRRRSGCPPARPGRAG